MCSVVVRAGTAAGARVAAAHRRVRRGAAPPRGVRARPGRQHNYLSHLTYFGKRFKARRSLLSRDTDGAAWQHWRRYLHVGIVATFSVNTHSTPTPEIKLQIGSSSQPRAAITSRVATLLCELTAIYSYRKHTSGTPLARAQEYQI